MSSAGMTVPLPEGFRGLIVSTSRRKNANQTGCSPPTASYVTVLSRFCPQRKKRLGTSLSSHQNRNRNRNCDRNRRSFPRSSVGTQPLALQRPVLIVPTPHYGNNRGTTCARPWSESQLTVRTQSHEFQGFHIRLAVNQDQVRFYVTISMVLPFA